MLYACDYKWWKWHEGLSFAGRKITQDIKAAEEYGIEYIESKDERGLSLDHNIIHQGSNSGYQAINLAYHMGAKRVLLLGYDMQKTGGKAHWFGDHPDKCGSDYGLYASKFTSLAKHAVELGLEIVNCSRNTALNCFSIKKIDEAL